MSWADIIYGRTCDSNSQNWQVIDRSSDHRGSETHKSLIQLISSFQHWQPPSCYCPSQSMHVCNIMCQMRQLCNSEVSNKYGSVHS